MHLKEKRYHRFHESLIKYYDIRGVFQETLFSEDAYFFGCAFGNYIKQHYQASSVNIACDNRSSSPILKKELEKGLVDVGLNVIDLGYATSPLLYYSCNEIQNSTSGIVVTASHNSSNYNGFKIVTNKKYIYGKEIEKLLQPQSIDDLNLSKKGTVRKEIDIKNKYIEHITNPKTHFYTDHNTDSINHIKVAWDLNGGVSRYFVEKMIKLLPGIHYIIENINSHNSTNTDSKLDTIKNFIKKSNCDYGFVLDEDADRLLVVDKQNKIYLGDQLLCLFTKDLLTRHKNAKIITDIKASKSYIDEIEKLGAKILISKTGHSIIKNNLKNHKALLAGEVSGHLYFSENYYGFDDALFAASKLIYLLADNYNKEYLRSLSKEYLSKEIKVKVDNKFSCIAKIKKILDAAKKKYCDLDGVRVDNKQGWWIIRASNTEKILIVRFEGYSKSNFHFIFKDLSNILSFLGLNIYQ
ncbi:MAG: phosphomannomutase [Candidatus Midichloriaceae bacterium]|jgi:phosphomannomutase